MEFWFGIPNSDFRQFSTGLPAHEIFVISFQDNSLINLNGFSPNLTCALILWRSGLRLLMGKFCQFLTNKSARDTSIFSFPDNNLSKYQWMFTKLAACIDIVGHWYGIATRVVQKVLSLIGFLCFIPGIF